MNHDKIYKIALIGNPNVGKSTIFNRLTGLNQHTGNWSGKTVEVAEGKYFYNNKKYIIIDLPGTYSLNPNSEEEKVSRDYLFSGEPDVIVIVCDATCLERNLILTLQILKFCPNVIINLNLIDEAEKKGIVIDGEKLSELLKSPVVKTSARSGKSVLELKKSIAQVVCDNKVSCHETIKNLANINQDTITGIVPLAEEIANKCVLSSFDYHSSIDKKIDRFVLGKFTAIPILILFLLTLFWITIHGSSYLSSLLVSGFNNLGNLIEPLFALLPDVLYSLLFEGVYNILTWVIAVMLPSMAIFFPLFTLLEDAGFLPRVAFNLDNIFKKANTCGKQALTMCMGFGCNACGVIGAKIFSNPKEKLIAIITNSFIPCNGRLPFLIALSTMFIIGNMSGIFESISSALVLTLLILISVMITFLVSKILSKTILKGQKGTFTLELPPYRKPQIGKVLLRSLLDRTLFVLGRAVVCAIPAGVVIWCLANFSIDGVTLLKHCADFLYPFGKILGMDGVIILAFLLAFPANEIVLPLIIMCYMSGNVLTEVSSLSEISTILYDNNWTFKTVVCVMVFTVFHFPCSTTCFTIYKETGSLKWTLISFFIPLAIGILICFLLNIILFI